MSETTIANAENSIEIVEERNNQESKFLASSQARSANLVRDRESRIALEASNSLLTESSTTYLTTFSSTHNSTSQTLQTLLTSHSSGQQTITSKARSTLVNALDNVRTTCYKLREDTAKASLFLNKYDVRSCESKITDLLKTEETLRKQLAPRLKFVFKSRRKNEDNAFVNLTARTEVVLDGGGMHEDLTDAIGDDDHVIGFTDVTDDPSLERLNQSNPTGIHYRLKNLTNSVITLLDSFGALRLHNLTNCTIYVATVSGPCYVENCTNCTIFVACRQLRIHDCVKVSFNVHVVSGPIIEGCSKLTFGPYKMDYTSKDSLFAYSGLSDTINLWEDVKDFKWLKNNVRSPNWRLVEEEDWVDVCYREDVVRVTTGGVERRVERERVAAEEERRIKEEAERRKGVEEITGVVEGDGGEEEDEDSEDEL